MKRGVGFATFLAMVISMLVVIIGSGISIEEGHDFQIGDLVRTCLIPPPSSSSSLDRIL